MEMTPTQLRFSMELMQEQDRLRKLEMAEAVSVAIASAFGNKEAWKSL